jgi:hypothetical protein
MEAKENRFPMLVGRALQEGFPPFSAKMGKKRALEKGSVMIFGVFVRTG